MLIVLNLWKIISFSLAPWNFFLPTKAREKNHDDELRQMGRNKFLVYFLYFHIFQSEYYKLNLSSKVSFLNSFYQDTWYTKKHIFYVYNWWVCGYAYTCETIITVFLSLYLLISVLEYKEAQALSFLILFLLLISFLWSILKFLQWGKRLQKLWT